MTEKSIVKELLGDYSTNILPLHEKGIIPSIKDSLKYFSSGNTSKNITKEKALELFEEYNEKYLLNNPIDKNKYEKVIGDNNTYTPEIQQKKYWECLKKIFASIKKTYKKYPAPVLPFGKSLSDYDFLELVEKAVKYACFSQKDNILNYMKNILVNIDKYTKNIFTYPNIVKDIKKNGILSIIYADTLKEKSEGLSYLKINKSTITPLLKLEFTINGKKYDLNKEELFNIFTSDIILKFYKKNLSDFIPDFNKKIENDDEIKTHIKNYLENYNIYFCDLPNNIMGVTLYSGNIYLKLKYIKEYFINKKSDVIDEDDSLIIREKIVLNLKHELNHVLVRFIDDEKKLNFFLKSENSKKSDNYLIFKDKSVKDITHKSILNESGNCFDYILYQGYYFDTLSKKEANFFLNINEIKDVNKYQEKFNEMMQDDDNYEICDSSINKFKTIIEEKPHCFKSMIFK